MFIITSEYTVKNLIDNTVTKVKLQDLPKFIVNKDYSDMYSITEANLGHNLMLDINMLSQDYTIVYDGVKEAYANKYTYHIPYTCEVTLFLVVSYLVHQIHHLLDQ